MYADRVYFRASRLHAEHGSEKNAREVLNMPKKLLSRHLYVSLCLLAVLRPGPAVAQQEEIPAYFDAQRWEEPISAFEAQDQANFPPTGAIVFNGSSSIYFWHEHLAEDMAPLTVIPRGFGGSTLLDALYYLDRIVLPYQPRAIVLYEGDNDIGRFKITPLRLRELFAGYVNKVRERLPETRIYLLAIKPSVARWADWPAMQEANRLLEELCAADPLLTYIDVATPLLGVDGMPDASLFVEDRLHLNRAGYELWQTIVRPVLLEHELAFEGWKETK